METKHADITIDPASPTHSQDELPPEFAEMADLRRGLKQRHIQMIGLAGAIGTGLFLGSGKAIAQAGPVGALLAYTIVGLLATAPVFCLAEMTALVPLSGGIVRHAAFFFDPALGFAVGWNHVFSSMLNLPSELVATAVIMEFWVNVNSAIWITVFGVLFVLSNIVLVRIYGELEFVFAILKILLIIGVNIMALVIVCGGGPQSHTYGFQYWRNPGPFVEYLGIKGSWGQFLGFWSIMSTAVYSYVGIQNTSLTASETESPRRNIPMAAKRVFWRVGIFYVLSIFMIGLIVPSTDKDLLHNNGTAASSPFTLAAERAGIKVVPSIINAVVLTSAWSAGNANMLWSSRYLYGLARDGRAPKIFTRTSRLGIPYASVTYFSLFFLLGYMTLSSSAANVFGWLLDLVSGIALVDWAAICLVYLRFYYAMKKQGISRDRLPWKSPFQPFIAWAGFLVFVLVLFTGGFRSFVRGQWNTQTFIRTYICIPVILSLYFGWKLFKSTKIIKLEDVAILKYIEIAENYPEPPTRPVKGWRRLNILWS